MHKCIDVTEEEFYHERWCQKVWGLWLSYILITIGNGSGWTIQYCVGVKANKTKKIYLKKYFKKTNYCVSTHNKKEEIHPLLKSIFALA